MCQVFSGRIQGWEGGTGGNSDRVRILSPEATIGADTSYPNTLSMEMRTKAAAGKTKNKADSIVRRELAAVLTNGTVVDEAFLSGDEACHCIAIKVRCPLAATSFMLARLTFTINRKRKQRVAIHPTEFASSTPPPDGLS